MATVRSCRWILTDELAEAYGKFAEEPPRPKLERAGGARAVGRAGGGGAAHFPLHPADLSTTGVALSAGTTDLCLLLALGMLLRNAVPAMALGIIFTGLLAAAHVAARIALRTARLATRARSYRDDSRAGLPPVPTIHHCSGSMKSAV